METIEGAKMDHLAEMAAFARVVDAKSFSAAARGLGISKSAVSKQVTKLENKLGARLLNRTTRHLSLTEVGAAVYAHCAHIVAESEAAVLAAHHLSATPRGVLKISAPIAFGKQHIALAMADFLGNYSEVSVQLVLTDRFVDLAEEGFDLAIRLTQKPGLNLVARKIAPVHYVVCASPGYVKRMGKPRTPQELTRHNCLFYAYQSTQDRWSFEGTEGNITVQVKGNFQVNSSEAIREALLMGLGIGLVPTFTVGQDLKSGILLPLLKKYRTAGFNRNIYAVYLPNRTLSPKVRAFIDFLVARFGDEHYWDH